MNSAPPITAIAPWYGAKRNLAAAIVEELGPHRVFWDPACGSLATLFAKPPCRAEIVNDLHGELINLARCLKAEQAARELWGRLGRVLLHEGLFDEAADRVRARGDGPAGDGLDVDRAEDFMVFSWLGRNGIGGTTVGNSGFCVRFAATGGDSALALQNAAGRIELSHLEVAVLVNLAECGWLAIFAEMDGGGPAADALREHVETIRKSLPCVRQDTLERLAQSFVAMTRNGRLGSFLFGHRSDKAADIQPGEGSPG